MDHSHTYQQLPLIPVEDFLSLKPEHAEDDENALMIARIEQERAEREGLEQKRMELLKRKQKLISDNKKRKDDLANLDKELEKFIDVSRPEEPCHSEILTLALGRETYPEAFRKEHYLIVQLKAWQLQFTFMQHREALATNWNELAGYNGIAFCQEWFSLIACQ